MMIGEPGRLRNAVQRACTEALGDNTTIDICSDAFHLEAGRASQPVQTLVVLGASAYGLPTPVSALLEPALATIPRADLRRLVLISSAAVEVPRFVHPGMVRERRRPARGLDPCADTWADLEQHAQSWCSKHEVELTILRPAAMPFPGSSDPLARLVHGKAVATAAGHDPPIQLLDPEDLGRALARVLDANVSGVFHVAPAGVVPLHSAIRLSGGRRIPLPMWLLRLMRTAPRAERLRYTATVSAERLRDELGFEPHADSAEVARRAGNSEPGECPSFDDFGQDPAYIGLLRTTLLRFLHDVYWRVELAGCEHIPAAGPAVLTGVHRGFMPFDGSMALHGVARETGRLVRFLIHPSLVKMPFLADFIRRQGGVVACRDNADRLLDRGELVGVFPEGINGAFSSYRNAYRLRNDFARDEYVKMALRNRTPIVPFVTVGSVEIFPVLAKLDWGWWKRFTAWPCFPIAPPFPLAPIPLPTKWHTRFLEPIPVHEMHPPEAARDRRIVESISCEIKEILQAEIDRMLQRRRHVFFGSIFAEKA